MTLTDQKKQALELYINQSFTQQQVADALGVCVRTIHNWIKQHAWDRLRLATHQAPALIADNFSSQLVELQNNIAAREPGNRYPTTQEMEIMRKLTVCIANTKKTVSLPQVTQMMRMFRSFVFDNRSKPYAQGVADVIDAFLEARSRFGYSPYELEFGVEKIQHVDPLYNPYVDTIAKETTEAVISRFFNSEELTAEPNPKIHRVDTSKWSDKMRSAMMSEFGDIYNPETTNSKPITHSENPTIPENKMPLIINDLSTKTPETTSNEPAKPETFLEGLRKAFLQNQPQHPNFNEPHTTSNTAAIPEYKTSLIINDLSTKTPETTGNKPVKPETFLEGLRKAFLQNQPQHPNYDKPKPTCNTAAIPENETSLIINDSSIKTPETTGNEPAKQETFLEGLRKAFLENQPQHPNYDKPKPTCNTAAIPENETPLIINDLSTKVTETTGNKPETQPRSRSLPRSQNPVDPQYAGYPRSSTPPDPTVPYTYYSAKMLITKYPDGRIRYDYGGGRPAITITKGGPAILERRVFYI